MTKKTTNDTVPIEFHLGRPEFLSEKQRNKKEAALNKSKPVKRKKKADKK